MLKSRVGPIIRTVIVVGAFACDKPRDSASLRTLAQLQALAVPRTTAARTSMHTVHGMCQDYFRAGESIARDDCAPSVVAPEPSSSLLGISRQVNDAISQSMDAHTYHAAALIALTSADPGGKSINKSIKDLEVATRLGTPSAQLLCDVAAAYIVRSEREQSARDLLVAIDAGHRGLSVNSKYLPCLYNVALAEERFGLLAMAHRDWGKYLEQDASSPWAREARSRMVSLSALFEHMHDTLTVGTEQKLRALALAYPQRALTYALNTLLLQWANALTLGDSSEALTQLRDARTIAQTLQSVSGDRSLATLLVGLNANVRSDKTRRLALAHTQFAAAMFAFDSARYARADTLFNDVTRTLRAPEPLCLWSTAYAAISHLLSSRDSTALSRLQTFITRENIAVAPSLIARAQLAIGTGMLRKGLNGEALRHYADAGKVPGAPTDSELLAGSVTLSAEALFALGQQRDGYSAVQRGLRVLSRFPTSLRLHAVLYTVSKAAFKDGFSHAARVIADEDLQVANRLIGPPQRVESRVARLRYRRVALHEVQSSQDSTALRDTIASLDSDARNWFTADWDQFLAESLTEKSPMVARQQLAATIDFFRPRNVLRLAPALLSLANADVALGNSTDAVADLKNALDALQSDDLRAQSLDFRISMVEQARQIFDRLILLQLSRSDTAGALATLQSSRVKLAAVANENVEVAQAAPDHQPAVTLEYVLIGDTLLTWSVRQSHINFVRQIVPRAKLDSTITLISAAMQNGTFNGQISNALGSLYEQFIRPLQLKDDPVLTIVADGEISAVPFEMLHDTQRNQYLVEQHELRFAGGGARTQSEPVKRARVSDQVLLVADPAFDEAAFPAFSRLRGARAEVDSLGSLYPTAKTLAGRDARHSIIATQLVRTSLLHYAGHAVVDERRAEKSFLLTAPDSTGGRDVLTADDIAHLDLRGLKLAILSACQTVRARSGHTAIVGGLAGAILQAGAGGVIASQWTINDGSTAGFMITLHQALRTFEPAAALRHAQRQMIAKAKGNQQSPATWGAFRYISN